jgi:hypothetical protein
VRFFRYGAAVLLSAFLLLPAAGVSADGDWCEDDPAFMVNGKLIDVWIAAPLSVGNAYVHRGEKIDVDFVLYVPNNVNARIVRAHNPASPYFDESIRIQQDGTWNQNQDIPYRIVTRVSEHHDFNVRVTVSYDGVQDASDLQVNGRSGDPIVVHDRIPDTARH